MGARELLVSRVFGFVGLFAGVGDDGVGVGVSSGVVVGVDGVRAVGIDVLDVVGVGVVGAVRGDVGDVGAASGDVRVDGVNVVGGDAGASASGGLLVVVMVVVVLIVVVVVVQDPLGMCFFLIRVRFIYLLPSHPSPFPHPLQPPPLHKVRPVQE